MRDKKYYYFWAFSRFWARNLNSLFGNRFKPVFSRNIISLKVPKQDNFTSIKIPAMDLQGGDNADIISREINGNEFIIAEAQVARNYGRAWLFVSVR